MYTVTISRMVWDADEDGIFMAAVQVVEDGEDVILSFIEEEDALAAEESAKASSSSMAF